MNIQSEQVETSTELFRSKDWWKQTGKVVRDKIIKLAERHPVFINHFLSLRDENDKEKILAVSNLEWGKENAVIELSLISLTTNEKYEQEYVYNFRESTIRGKCLIVLETKNHERWLLLQKNIKPWFSKTILSGITAFFPNFSKNNLCEFPKKIEKGLFQICNKKNWNIKKIIDLGLIIPNSDFTANKIPLFIVEIATESEDIVDNSDMFLYQKEKEILGLIKKCDDAITLSILIKKLQLDKHDE